MFAQTSDKTLTIRSMLKFEEFCHSWEKFDICTFPEISTSVDHPLHAK